MTLAERYSNWIQRYALKWLEPYGSYKKLVRYLSQTLFTWEIRMDENRAADGIYFRYKCTKSLHITEDDVEDELIDIPCSVLEMMVALAFRIEQDLMRDYDIGDRAPLWFYEMLQSSGLDAYDDNNFDVEEVDDIIFNVLHHNYKPNGEGGFFTVYHADEDLRTVELWWQINWHMSEILHGRNHP